MENIRDDIFHLRDYTCNPDILGIDEVLPKFSTLQFLTCIYGLA